MKKILLVLVAVLMAATPAMATIKNSAHDLSANSSYTRQQSEAHKDADFDRICAFCHTPHYANMENQNAPLWNRTVVDAAGYDFYNSATLTDGVSDPTGVTAAVNDTDVPLCMSCHDGTSLTAVLHNPVNGLAGQPDAIQEIDPASRALLLDSGYSMTNDHPVGFNYANVVDPDIYGIGSLNNGGTIGFFGPGKNMMWCSSCHDVHEPGTAAGNDAPFLVTSNAASALCLGCHNK